MYIHGVVVQLLNSIRLFATPVDCSTPGSSVLHYYLEFAQILIHWVSDNYLTISTSVALLSFCLQSFSVSGSFSMSWLFAWCGQCIGASAPAATVLSINIQDWFPLGLTDLISMQSKGLSRVFSSTTIWKHQFFSTQPSYGPTLIPITWHTYHQH